MQLAKVVESCEKTEILAWVAENISKIRSHSRKYLAYSPYECEEFIQAAYEAALLAYNDENHEFEQSFWFHYKKACLDMTYTKGDKTLPCFHEEYIEFGDDERPPTYVSTSPAEIFEEDDATKSSDCLSHRQEEAVIRKALRVMTAKEREVWELLLLGMSLKKVAAILGKSKTAVIKLREAGKQRVKVFCLS